MDLVAVSFFASFSFGQWVVISIIGMLFLGAITSLMWGIEDGAWGFGFIWGMAVYWIMLGLATAVLSIISLCQWLWSL